MALCFAGGEVLEEQGKSGQEFLGENVGRVTPAAGPKLMTPVPAPAEGGIGVNRSLVLA